MQDGGAGQGSGGNQQAASSVKPGTGRDFVVNVGDRVFFEFDKSSLSSDARSQLEKQAAWLKKFGSVSLTLEGHADERGTREYNLALGERRANSAKDFLRCSWYCTKSDQCYFIWKGTPRSPRAE